AYGADVMAGMIPAPQTTNQCNDLFERTAVLLNDAFSFAHRLGIKTCAGTETPLVVPKAVQDRIASIEGGTLVAEGTKATRQALYEGIFRRVTQAYPLDYYWFWTPEDWTWSGVKPEQVQATLNDLNAATA